MDGNVVSKVSGNSLGELANGEHTVTVEATDVMERQGSATVTFTVNYTPPVVATTTLQDGYISAVYNQALAASGGVAPYKWSIVEGEGTGSLPPGLTLAENGIISGTPTVEGRSNFTVTMVDTNNTTVLQDLALAVGPPRSDLIGMTLQVDRTNITSGQILMFTARIKNQGTVAATGVGVSIYLSTDNVITTSDMNLGFLDDWTRYRDVGAGGETTIAGGIYMPQAPSGQYYIGIIVDAENLVPESNETNNGIVAATQITNTGLYQDLVVTALSADRVNYLRGQGITASYSYKNQGQYVARNDFNVRFYLSRDNVITPDDYYEEYLWDYNLAAGAEKTGTKALPTNYAEWYLPDGFYYLGMIMDVSNTNPESDEANNTFTGTRIYLGSDSTPPTGSISINSGAITTRNPVVTLALSATDTQSGVTQMQFSNDNATWTTAEDYAVTKSWTLPNGDGSKTVYVKYKDFLGNWSPAFAKTIILDTMPPAVTISSPLAVTTADNTPLLIYSVSDGSVVVKVDGVVVNKVSGNSLDVLSNGLHTLTVDATDVAGNMGNATVSFTVDYTPLAIGTTTLPNGTVSAVYSQALAASGGVAPYTWSVTTGSLPAGLSLAAATGVISGTPTAVGSSNFTIHWSMQTTQLLTKRLRSP